MRTSTKTCRTVKAFHRDSDGPCRTNAESDTSKKKWLQKYSRRLLELWLRWQTPLGIACTYAEQIREDLAEFYDDPLKRMFIETTYCGPMPR